MTTEALPGAETAAVSQTPEQIAATEALTAKNRSIDEADGEQERTESTDEAKPKAEKTQEQREADRLRRGIDRRTRQREEARAEVRMLREQVERLTGRTIDGNNQQSADDSAQLSLTRAELAAMVKAEAAKLAPTLRDQASEVERRQSVVQTLAKTWGQERFDELASDLDDAFGGLADDSGKPKHATEAVFEADNPARVIEWLADPDNADEAERISKLSAVRAGKEIAKLEATLGASKDKPQPSKIPAPIEPVRGAGQVKKSLLELSGDAFEKRRKEQIAQRR